MLRPLAQVHRLFAPASTAAEAAAADARPRIEVEELGVELAGEMGSVTSRQTPLRRRLLRDIEAEVEVEGAAQGAAEAGAGAEASVAEAGAEAEEGEEAEAKARVAADRLAAARAEWAAAVLRR